MNRRKILYFICWFAPHLMGCEPETKLEFPTVFTLPAHEITRFSAHSGGETLQEGSFPVIARGICWNTVGQPTILEDTTLNGQGPGAFQSVMQGLHPDITYYVRAYATTSVGTAYGEEHTFRTSNLPEYLHPQLTYEQITDIDGNYYYTIVIGQQVWMAQNLQTTHFANGDRIEYVSKNWSTTYTAAWCYPKDDPALNLDYGKLYNGYTARDPRNPCPNGWHVPSKEDWKTLSDFLGGDSLAVGKIKTNGKSYNGQNFWANLNPGTTNESGFSALPGGSRNPNGFFSGFVVNGEFFEGFGHVGVWWDADAGSRWLMFHEDYFYPFSSVNTSAGYCIRCVKD